MNSKNLEYQPIKQRLPLKELAVRDGPLSLTPLEVCHKAAFMSQYSGDIAEMCKLPEFGRAGEMEWEAWLVDYLKHPSANLFAIYHEDRGFIGSVGLDCHQGAGFFFYWLGADFQARGYGPRVVELLLEWAARNRQVTCCYAVTYEDNIPSIKALRKLAFEKQPLKLADGGDEAYVQEEVFYRGPEKSVERLYSELNDLFAGIGSELRVVL